jgi:hypothetical protein
MRERFPTVSVIALIAAAVAWLALAAGCDTTYVFDDIDLGDDHGARAPREKSNSQYLRAVYADLIGRAPEAYEFEIRVDGQELFRFPIDEQRALVQTLDGVGDPAPLRALLAAGLVHSSEIELPAKSEVDDPEAFIADQFRRYLGRDPGVYELRAFLDEWDADPAVNPRTVVRAILGAREYQSY